ncbi:MAG: hypothetical protein NC078_03920 [Ruminococcus sp.]|nr:hypothetical protein [Ruminococcus sp.]
MANLKWDEVGERRYETGVSKGVLYLLNTEADKPAYDKGVAWNGLSSIDENPGGAEATKIYADNIEYLNITGAETFEASIKAYTYPDEFAACDGSKELLPGVYIGMQGRATFGMSYRTVVGNDVKNNEYGYKITLVYGAKAKPSSKTRSTINESPEATEFSWDITTTPVPVTGHNATATLILDSTKLSKAAMEAIEAVLYGTDETEARLPYPDEVAEICKTAGASGE